MLLVSIGLWIVVVYGTRVAVAGNPVHEHLARCDPGLLKRCEPVVAGMRPAADADELYVVRRFYRLFMLGLFMFVLELVLLIGLWWSRVMPALCVGLLLKNALAVVISIAVSRTYYVGERPLQGMLSLPSWVVVSDRVSSLISAVGFLPLFLCINDLWVW